jgi:hypothetical protein
VTSLRARLARAPGRPATIAVSARDATETPRDPAGTMAAMVGGMAAVFALVFLFAFASTALFVKGLAGLSLGTALAGGVFFGLCAGVFLDLLRLVKNLEGPEGHVP